MIIPALNEEGDLEKTVQEMLSILNGRFSSYELIIINDGSTDETRAIADRLARNHENIRVIHHEQNKGLGYTLREGYSLAAKDYTVWSAGDRGMKSESFAAMFDRVGKADLIIPYIANPKFRSLGRRLTSSVYIFILNLLFGLKLKCYNGSVVYRTQHVQAVRTTTTGFFFFAELLIPLVKSGCSYLEIPTYHRERPHGSSRAVTLENFLEIAKKAFSIWWDLVWDKSNRVRLSAPVKVG